MKLALIRAYLQASQVGQQLSQKHKNVDVGVYRNPLFSDVPALVLFKFLKFKGEEGKRIILDKLGTVLLQELKRIRDLRKSEEVDKDGNPKVKKRVTIEFYNDEKRNGFKLNYFPELNSSLEELLSLYDKVSSIQFQLYFYRDQYQYHQ